MLSNLTYFPDKWKAYVQFYDKSFSRVDFQASAVPYQSTSRRRFRENQWSSIAVLLANNPLWYLIAVIIHVPTMAIKICQRI